MYVVFKAIDIAGQYSDHGECNSGGAPLHSQSVKTFMCDCMRDACNLRVKGIYDEGKDSCSPIGRNILVFIFNSDYQWYFCETLFLTS